MVSSLSRHLLRRHGLLFAWLYSPRSGRRKHTFALEDIADYAPGQLTEITFDFPAREPVYQVMRKGQNE